jgi:hypothetical protein
MTTDPAWLHEGATVAVHDHTTARLAKVVKMTKRDVVLDDGLRINRESLVKRNPSAWTSNTYLADPKDPMVVKMRADQRRRNIVAKATLKTEKLLLDWRKGGPDTLAQEAADVLTAALNALATQLSPTDSTPS